MTLTILNLENAQMVVYVCLTLAYLLDFACKHVNLIFWSSTTPRVFQKHLYILEINKESSSPSSDLLLVDGLEKAMANSIDR